VAEDLLLEQPERFEIRARKLRRSPEVEPHSTEEEPVTTEIDAAAALDEHDEFANFSAPV